MKKFALFPLSLAAFIATLTISCQNELGMQQCAGKDYDPEVYSCLTERYCTEDEPSECYTREILQPILGGSSSSGAIQDPQMCDSLEYDPETQFCYINNCGHPKSCDENPLQACPAVCVPREAITEKCNGKEYDPNTEKCYGNFVAACRGQVSDCGGCVKHTDCAGNPVTDEYGMAVEICYERTANCGIGKAFCDGKEYDPKTHFCYIDRIDGCTGLCAPDEKCLDMCVRKYEILEKCNGKEYDPKTEKCYGNVVACKMGIPNCGGCVKLKDCNGNPVSDAEVCYARPANCKL